MWAIIRPFTQVHKNTQKFNTQKGVTSKLMVHIVFLYIFVFLCKLPDDGPYSQPKLATKKKKYDYNVKCQELLNLLLYIYH